MNVKKILLIDYYSRILYNLPMVPTFSPNVFVPFPLPQRPANIVPRPSIPIPRLIA